MELNVLLLELIIIVKVYQVMYWNSGKSSKSSINTANNFMNLACEPLICKSNKTKWA